MKINPIVSAILRGVWAIEPSHAMKLLPMADDFLQGKFVLTDDETPPVVAYAIEPVSGMRMNLADAKGEGLICVIPVLGPIMKADACGDPGTATLANWVKQADNNPAIAGIILQIDSPGGSVDGTKEFADVIAAVVKPVVTYVDGLMASAGYWIGSAADEIIASSETAMIGSIGTMASFTDWKGYYEKNGIVEHTIYADASTDKNKYYHEALANNYKVIKNEMLNPLNDEFTGAVKKQRGDRLKAKADGVLSGRLFAGELALANGLIDAIGNFDLAIERTRSLINNQNLKVENMKFSTAWKNTLTFLGIKTEDAANTDVTVEHIEKLEAEVAAKIELTVQYEKLCAENADQAGQILSLDSNISNAQAIIKALEEKVAVLSKKDGAAVVETAKGDDAPEMVEATGFEHVDFSADHNQDLIAHLESVGCKVVNGKVMKPAVMK